MESDMNSRRVRAGRETTGDSGILSEVSVTRPFACGNDREGGGLRDERGVSRGRVTPLKMKDEFFPRRRAWLGFFRASSLALYGCLMLDLGLSRPRAWLDVHA